MMQQFRKIVERMNKNYMSEKVFKVLSEDKFMFYMLPDEHIKLLNYVLESNKKLEKLAEDYNKIIKQIDVLVKQKEDIIKSGNILSFHLYMEASSDGENSIINYNIEDDKHNNELKCEILCVIDVLINERNRKLAALSVEIHDILKNYKVEE